MLIQFTTENYLSFREKVVFSMRASEHEEHPGHVIAGRVPVVRGAAVSRSVWRGGEYLRLAWQRPFLTFVPGEVRFFDREALSP